MPTTSRSSLMLALRAENELKLVFVEAEFEPRRIFVRIIEPLDSGMQRRELLPSMAADCLKRRRFINEFSAAQYRHEQVFVLRCRGKVFATSEVRWINDRETPRNWPRYVVDSVAHELSALAETADLEDTGIGGFGGMLRKLHLVLPGSVRLTNRREFIYAAQRGLIVGGHEHRADAPHVDGSALLFQTGDEVFIEIVAGNNGSVFESSRIEHFSCFDTEISQIAGIEPDAGQFMAALLQSVARGDCVADAFERIECIHEEDGVVRQRVSPRVEGREFIIEGHDPA